MSSRTKFAFLIVTIVSFVTVRSGIAVSAATPLRIAYVDTDSNIHVCEGDCKKPQCLTCPVASMEARRRDRVLPVRLAPVAAASEDTEYGWPTFSPNGRKLAYVSARGRRAAQNFGVWVYDFDKKESLKIFESPTERGIYMYWLPDGKRLSFLVTEPDNRLSLMLAEVRENAPIRIVTSGWPLYYDWGPHPDELLVHTNQTRSENREQVWLMNLTPTGQEVERMLWRGRAPFKSPCWSRDGKHLALVATQDDVARIYVADPDGKNPKPIAKLLPGESSFVWSPDSRHLAFSTAQLPPNTVFDGISIVDIADGSIRKIVNEDVAAFYFSPDGNRLAYIGVPPQRPYFTWNVIDLRTPKKRELAKFVATTEGTIAARYFEQLSLSHTIWAPDSSAFVFAGVILKEVPKKAPATIPTPPPQVVVMPIDGGKPRYIAKGIIAFWSPAP
ncbi:MAG: hypothetical protein WA005_02200 [Candidatus Binataceae bacterium]